MLHRGFAAEKRETARDLPLAECLEYFESTPGRELEQVKLQKNEHPMELLELGTTMVAKYLGEAAPLIQPAAVESRVAGIIGGVRVSGYVDLLDAEGRLTDSKSAIKPIRGIAHDHRLQLTSYAIITPAATRRSFIPWFRIPSEMESFCRGATVLFVGDGTADIGTPAKGSTVAP